jgi:hypothetical protein
MLNAGSPRHACEVYKGHEIQQTHNYARNGLGGRWPHFRDQQAADNGTSGGYGTVDKQVAAAITWISPGSLN